MIINVKPSDRRQFRDGSADFTCVGLQDIEVEVLAGPEPIRSYRNQGTWQPLEGVYEVMESAAGGLANAILCQYGPMRGILIYGGPLGINIAGHGVPVIWTQNVEEIPDDVRAKLGVDKFSQV